MKLATTYQQKLKNMKGVICLPNEEFNIALFSLKNQNQFLFHIINNNKQQKEDL